MTHLHLSLSSEAITIELANVLSRIFRAGDLVVLKGDLGAGKTFFSGALVHALGLDQDEPVTSPTYTLVHEYPTTPPVFHCDLYRLSDEDEIFDLGLEEARSRGALLLVEWGLPYVEVLGGEAIVLEFEVEPRAFSLAEGSGRQAEVFAALQASALSFTRGGE